MNPWKPKVLLLGPGGVKGFLMMGSLLFLEKTKLLKEIDKIVGISIGSVVGLMYQIGYTVGEIIDFAFNIQLGEMISTIDMINIMKKNGLISHEIIRKKLHEKVVQKYGFIPTLKQLYMMTGTVFEVVVTNLNTDNAEYFSHETEPDLSCVEAVLMSISLPLFFQSYEYKDSLYLDGGLSEPFPVHRYEKEQVFGIMMKGSPVNPKQSFFNYLSRIIKIITSTRDKRLKINGHCKVLNLEYEVDDAIGVKIGFEKRVDMVMIGYLRAFYFYQEISKKYPELYPHLRKETIDFCHALQYDVKFTQRELSYIHVDESGGDESDEEEVNEHLMEMFESSSLTDFSVTSSSEDSLVHGESGLGVITDDLGQDVVLDENKEMDVEHKQQRRIHEGQQRNGEQRAEQRNGEQRAEQRNGEKRAEQRTGEQRAEQRTEYNNKKPYSVHKKPPWWWNRRK